MREFTAASTLLLISFPPFLSPTKRKHKKVYCFKNIFLFLLLRNISFATSQVCLDRQSITLSVKDT